MVSGDICVIGESAQLFLQPVIAPSCGRSITGQKLAGLDRCKCCELIVRHGTACYALKCHQVATESTVLEKKTINIIQSYAIFDDWYISLIK